MIVAFASLIFMSWYTFLKNGIYFTGPGSNASASFFYIIFLLYLSDILISLIPILIIKKRVKKHMISYSKIEFYAISILFNYLTFVYIFLAYVFINIF